jgi:transcriptional regulator with XRE-family HTH domain
MEMKINTRLLKKLREEKSWSQEHLAEVSNLSLRTVQRVEADGNASPETKMALASVLGVDAAHLGAEPIPGLLQEPMEPQAEGKGFLVHLFIYVTVNTALVLLDIHNSGSVTWARWPMLGWGVGLVSHWLRVRKTWLRMGDGNGKIKS